MHPLDLIENHLVRAILSPEAQAQYHLGNVAARELTPFIADIQAISEQYVTHAVGTALTSPIRTKRAALAYALYYSPINAAKVLHLLPLISLSKTEVSVLDVGCGPGTVGLSLLASLSSIISLDCIESSPEMRGSAFSLLESWVSPRPLRALSIKQRLTEIAPESRYDLVVAANVLAELPHTDASTYLTRLCSLVGENGYLILIEPGQPAHTRRLMQLRDHALQQFSDLSPVFPCLRRDPCPMLQYSQTDWCHGVIEWYQPRLHAQLDRLLGFNKHRIKFSAFIFQRGAQLLPGLRVLTSPEKSHRGVEGLVCGQNLYGNVLISKRNRSPSSRTFEKAKVFDRLVFDPPCTGEAPANIKITNPTKTKQDAPVAKN